MTNHSTGTTGRPATTLIRRRLRGAWRGRPLPVHPLLLAAYPVLFLYGANLGELELTHLFGPLVVVLAATLVLLVIGAAVLRDSRRAALVVSALAAMLLLYGHLAGILGPRGVLAGFQQIGWAVFLIAAVALALRLGSGRLASVTRALNLVTTALVVFALVTIVPADTVGLAVAPPRPRRSVGLAARAATSTSWSSTATDPRAHSTSYTRSTTGPSSTDSAPGVSRS